MMIMKTPFKPNRPKYLLLVLVAVATVLTQGCHYERHKPDTPKPVPKGLPSDTQAIVAITSDGRMELRDAEGGPLPKCQICTPELEKRYGDSCKDVPAEAQVCGSLPPMQVRKMINLNILHLKGSDCWFGWPEGNWIQWWPTGCTPR